MKAKAVKIMDERTIERVEEKYLITKSMKTQLLKRINKHLEHDDFYKEEVLSLYFDSDNFDLAIRSIERPTFKEKIRVRSYNVPKKSSKVFFEVKSKLKVKKKKIGNKRRLVLPLKDFYRYYEKGEDLEKIVREVTDNDAQQIQVARELDYLMKYYDLKPKMIIVSDRTAYDGKENKHFRLTFDENLRFRTDNLKLEKGSQGEKYFPAVKQKKNVIMEVKTMNAMPPWFIHELSELKIYPSRFSKYGKIYQLIKERKDNNV